METSAINPSSVPEATGGYVNGLEVRGADRMLFISGQIPQDGEGRVPEDIESQCRLVWSNLTAVLHAADMDVTNLVKVTTFLSDRVWADVNSTVRREVLGSHLPALTVVITGIWDPAWMIEVEAIAAA
jgi:2-iminobutanoate/2-iminopropanoate deaminase